MLICLVNQQYRFWVYLSYLWCFLVGVGKTTLIKHTCDALRSRHIPVQGFYTQECRQHGCRIGFDVVTLAGDRQPLARLKFLIYLYYGVVLSSVNFKWY